MAMKILNFFGGGGMFMEFFSCDFDENFIMVGHDGPGHHSALGVGDFSREIEMFAEKMGFDCVRI